jgi:signal transduction histidine kinase/DNA-binding response OmpR family regulator/ligand-binding sensor domain-containing protein
MYSHEGIEKYDGDVVKRYSLPLIQNVRTGEEAYTTIQCASDGRIWLSLKNGNIYSFDPEKDSFSLFEDLSKVVHGAMLYNILPSSEGLYCCLSDGLYFCPFKRSSREVTRIALPGEQVYGISRVNDNEWYIGAKSGIFLLEKKDHFTIRKVCGPLGSTIREMKLFSGKLLVGTYTGLYTLSLDNCLLASTKQITNGPVSAIDSMRDGNVAIASDGAGLFLMNVSDDSVVKHYMMAEHSYNSLCSNALTDICIDRDGRAWITTVDGACCLEPHAVKVEWLMHEGDVGDPGSRDRVNVIMQDVRGTIWTGSDKGLFRKETGTDVWSSVRSIAAVPHNILTICEDDKGTVWVGGYGMKVYAIDPRTGAARMMPTREVGGHSGVASEYIYAIYCENRYVWMGGIEGQLTRYDQDSGKYDYFDLDIIGDIIPYSDDELVMATSVGLAFVDKETGSVKTSMKLGGVTLGNPVRAVVKSPKGLLWLATDGEGLVCYDRKRNAATQYSIEDGLSSKTVNSLVADKAGRLWFTTNDALYFIDDIDSPVHQTVMSAEDFINLPRSYYNDKASFCLEDGALCFGTNDGAFYFYPDLPGTCISDLNLYLYDFEVSDSKEPVSSFLDGRSINESRSIRLPYRQNGFKVSASAINFGPKGRLVFDNTVTRGGKVLVHTSDQHLSLMGLRPGRYHISFALIDKVSNKILASKALSVKVKASLWASWWAIVIYLLFSASIIYLINRFHAQREEEAAFQDKIRLFAGLAHDIKTPISLIKAPLNELESDAGIEPEVQENLKVAARNADRISDMVNQLLEIQKAETKGYNIKFTEVELRPYIEGRIAEFSILALKKSIELTSSFAPDAPSKIMIDRNRMDHVIENLLSNAIKYTDEGTVTVSVGGGQKHWTLTVRDSGVGIPKEDQKKIFRDFFRSRNVVTRKDDGMGIGLMVTRRFVQQMNGSITFSSEEGEGSIFIVELPVIMPENLTDDSQASDADRFAVGQPDDDYIVDEGPVQDTLLLVDDDKEFVSYMSKVLSANYKVLTAYNGAEALDIVRQSSPDILVSDIMMPVMRGDDLCRTLKNSVDTSHIPVILLSALDDKENIIMGLETGANDYIVKPFDISVLKLRVRNLIRSRNDFRRKLLSENGSPVEEDYTNILDKQFMDKVMELIDEQMDNTDLVVEDFCMSLGMSRSSFFNKLKALTEENPNSFVRIVRLNRGKELLSQHRYSIVEVSSMVGFSDSKYFSTCFKHQFGFSPSKI